MAKREIKDSQDLEDADADYQPPSVDTAGERPSTQSRRVTRSTATNPPTDPQNQDQQHYRTAQTQPASQLDDLPTGSRVTRPRATNDEIAQTSSNRFPVGLPTGPPSTRPRNLTYDDIARLRAHRFPVGLPTGPPSTQPGSLTNDDIARIWAHRFPVGLPAGPPAIRSRPQHDGTVQTQSALRPAAPSIEPRVNRSQATQRTAEIRPDSKVVTDAQPPSKHSAPERSAARPKPRQTKRKTQTKTKAATPYRTHLEESLPPLADLHDIFKDMVSNAKEKIHLAQAMNFLSDKQIRVATMCSGTESPLLALDMIQNGKR